MSVQGTFHAKAVIALAQINPPIATDSNVSDAVAAEFMDEQEKYLLDVMKAIKPIFDAANAVGSDFLAFKPELVDIVEGGVTDFACSFSAAADKLREE